MTPPSLAAAKETLQRVFGFPEFRQGQREVVERLLAGRSVLAIFPTGGGKSLCYQLPALLLEGLTLVVSPLIALMKDQIDFLTRRGVAAARLDSSLEASEARRIFTDLRGGKLKLLYIAPERLANERFLQTLRGTRIAMLAVDEAHCISEWGHNFRPDYLKLAALARDLKVGRVLGLTATATPEVADQVARGFGIAPDDVVLTGFHRPNLTLRVTPCTPDERRTLLVSRLRAEPAGPSIVYVTLQKTAEEVAGFLQRSGFAAEAYHAGLDPETRHAVQDRFMSSDRAVVVATIAFGMGIDKADIRKVVHFNLPKSLENYAQEIGRAGRDGKPADCDVLACGGDRIVLENFSYGDTPSAGAVAAFLAALPAAEGEFDISTYEMCAAHDVRPLVAETLLTYLELDGLLELTGPFYSEYKFQPSRPSTEILAKFDPARADFLRKVLARSRKASKWFHIDVHAAALALGEPRRRIVAALNYLEEQGDLTLSIAGTRQGYRRKRPNPPGLRERMSARFAEREQRDIARLGQVLEFAGGAGCRTRRLLTHFGETLPGDCGHCDVCLGGTARPMPDAAGRPLGAEDSRLLDGLDGEGHDALADPRARTRFLCGLTSPAATRAKLGKHDLFGVWADVPFASVLDFVSKGVTRISG